MKDANGRAFRYVSIKDWPKESKKWDDGKVEVRRVDEVFERMFYKGTPRTSPYAYLEDDEEEEEEEEEEGEGKGEEEEEGSSNQKDKACSVQKIQIQRKAYTGKDAP
jgi:hypothetical protein